MSADVERELRALSGVGDIQEAAEKVGLLPFGGKFEIERASAWRRGGGETYILEFDANCAGELRSFILKACTPSSAAGSLERTFRSWIDRRSLLSANGVGTPRLYAAGDGVILEEYVPELYMDVLRSSDNRSKLIFELGRVLGTLERLKFKPRSLLNDLRSHGGDVVLIDFGEDLGGVVSDRQTVELTELVQAEASAAGLDITTADIATLREGRIVGRAATTFS